VSKLVSYLAVRFTLCHGSLYNNMSQQLVSLIYVYFRKESEMQQPPLYQLAAKHAGGESKYDNI